MNINVIVEIPQGSQVKYELDKKTNRITVDRFLHTAMLFPFNYGFIPETLAEDKDPVDVLVIASYPVIPGSVLPAHPIGLLEMEDEAGIDIKIIAVPEEKIDPLYGTLTDISQLDESIKAKIKHFFEHYKELEKGKWVKLKNWQSRAVAEKSIETARKKYR
ncbi:inorganic diphosphatase [Patescibacteria group bacterium]|nr:inorganic diphosphatase [Patescibacteria group bacterium]MBU1931705.1 inorganic diphosphatase [Patescibacteria group bacterium]